MSKIFQLFLFILLFLVFLVQSISIINLNVKHDRNDTFLLLAGLVNKDLSKISDDIKVCVYNDKSILKCDLDLNTIQGNFVYKKHNSLLYYKYDSIINGDKYNVVLAKSCVYSKSVLSAIMLFGSGFLIFFFLLYLIYKNNIKSLLWHKNAMNTFFHDAMHELKTPLGVALFNISMIDESKYKNRIKSALNQMKVTYEDVEYYIKNPHTKYDLAKLNMSEILKERINYFSTLIELKNIYLKCEIDDEVYVFLSEIELIRLIDNNISNAIKYTKSKIIIKLLKSFDKIDFIIIDDGAGIKDFKAIFNRYTREDKAQGGFGIGLNIVKNICVKFDIDYEVKREDNKTIFIYKIKEYKKLLLD